MSYGTGYFATPGKGASVTHVVLTDHGNLTLCGRRPKGEYQWCSSGIWLEAVECLRCKASAKRITQRGSDAV